MNILKKVIMCCVFTIIVAIFQLLILNYCLSNVSLHVIARANEQAYTEYADKIMGLSGEIKNNTFFL